MNSTNIALHEGEFARLKSILSKTQRALHAQLVLLIERSGQSVAFEGSASDIDLTALGSLVAANVAATDGLARLVGEPEFSILYHQGKNRNIHISSVSNRYCLVVVHDGSVGAGVVRLRVRHATAYLEEIFRLMARRAGSGSEETNAQPRLDFTDEDIDKLFGI
jgi:predicted regulator of Ras-like GTPase activity (Roadblock/LC7/MglB family)